MKKPSATQPFCDFQIDGKTIWESEIRIPVDKLRQIGPVKKKAKRKGKK